jgi:DNA-binding MarR family transcriptional regulator
MYDILMCMNKSTTNLVENYDLSSTTTYQAGIAQATMHRKLQKFCDDVLEPYGITKVQWLIVGTVLDYKSKGIRISDLANIIGTNLPYMTNTVNKLEDVGVLARVDNQLDNRSNLITVTPSFTPKCKKIEATLRGALRNQIYSTISVDDFHIYMKVLYKLAKK